MNHRLNIARKLFVAIATPVCLMLSAPGHGAGLKDFLSNRSGAQKENKPEAGSSAASAGSGQSQIRGLPTIAGATPDTDEEIQIGEGIAGIVLGTTKIWNNPKAQKYINLIGRNIAQNSERKEFPWAFAIIDTHSINSFAVPGGIVLVTRSLYQMMETEDELAAILAHDIAHINRHHYDKVIKQQKVALSSNTAAGKDSVIAKKLVAIGAELLSHGLDKDAEFEADRDAMVLAARAGYDASSILTVLEKLRAKPASDDSMQLLSKTHPAPAERIQKLKAISSQEIKAAAIMSPAAQRINQDGN